MFPDMNIILRGPSPSRDGVLSIEGKYGSIAIAALTPGSNIRLTDMETHK
jgi:hypothetical protein